MGRGWLYEPHDFDFSSETQSHPYPNLPPLDWGRNRIADTVKGRLKIGIYEFQMTSFIIRLHQTPLQPSFPRRRESIGGIRFVWMILKISVTEK